jgi:hypothetical protein
MGCYCELTLPAGRRQETATPRYLLLTLLNLISLPPTTKLVNDAQLCLWHNEWVKSQLF